MLRQINTHCQPIEPTVIESYEPSITPKMYIGSVAVSECGTWLVSFSCAQRSADGILTPERVFVKRSVDGGRTWLPRQMVYDGKDQNARQAEMGQFVVVPGTGRIYLFSIRHTGVRFGQMVFTYSDDDGQTWLGPKGPNTAYDVKVPPYLFAPRGDSNHLMAKGIWLSNGKYLLPFSIASDPPELGEIESENVFMMCDNFLTEDNPERLRFHFFPEGNYGLRVPHPNKPQSSLAQEPHVVELTNGFLMCVMRTGQGCIYYALSSDFGQTWSQPKPLCYAEGGKAIPHPNAPCPFYRLRNGMYVLFFHNNDGKIHGARGAFDFRKNRRPLYLSVGRYVSNVPNGGQPMIFSSPRFLLDSDGIPASILETTEISCYGGIIENADGVYFIHSNKWEKLQMFRIPSAMLDDSVLY